MMNCILSLTSFGFHRICLRKWWPAYCQRSGFQSTAPQTRLASLPLLDSNMRARYKLTSSYVSRQSVETDETAKKPDLIKMPVNSEEEREAITHLEQAISTCGVTSGDVWCYIPQPKSRSRLLLSISPHHCPLLCREIADEPPAVWKGRWQQWPHGLCCISVCSESQSLFHWASWQTQDQTHRWQDHSCYCHGNGGCCWIGENICAVHFQGYLDNCQH